MNAPRIAAALALLAHAEETHDGAPADTNLARAQVLATIAVAEQLAELTQAITRVYPPAPAPDTTSGQAETTPEQPDGPVLTLSDRYRDGDGEIWWVAANAAGELRLTLGGCLCTWGEVDGAYGLMLVERAGCRRTTNTVTAAQLRAGRVVSCEAWEDGAPVTITGSRRVIADDACRLEVEYRPLGGDRTTVVAVGSAAKFTLWDEDGTCGDCATGRCHGTDPDDCDCDRHNASTQEAAQ